MLSINPNDSDLSPVRSAIRATVETAKRFLGDDYDEDHEGDDALLNEIGESMETIGD